MSRKKDFDSIIREVTEGLTGKRDVDLPLVFERLLKYKGRSDIDELRMAAFGAVYQNLSEEEFGKILSASRPVIDTFIDDLERIADLRDASKHKEALKICERLYKRMGEANGRYQDGETKVYHSFTDPFETAIEAELCGVKQVMIPADKPYVLLYIMYGRGLLDLNRPEEARAVFEEAFRWSPVNMDVRLGYIESFMATQDWEKARELILDAFRFAFLKGIIREFYRMLGKCYEEMGDHDLAAACYFTAFRVISDSQLLNDDLSGLEESSGRDYSAMSKEEVNAKLKESGIPDGPNMELVNLARDCALSASHDKDWESARHYFEIVYELTEDKKLIKILEKLDDILGPEYDDDDDFDDEPIRKKRPLSPAQKAKKNKKRRKK